MKEYYFVITQTHVIGSAGSLEDTHNINNTYNLTLSFKWTNPSKLLSPYSLICNFQTSNEQKKIVELDTKR